MGEAADDMLDGSVCECCGEWFDDIIEGRKPPGHPRLCERCQDRRDMEGEADD